MLPEQSFPVAEIMQTEDIENTKSVDNDLSLNNSAEFAMTVKEESCDKASPVSPANRILPHQVSAIDRDDTGSQNFPHPSASPCGTSTTSGDRGRGRGRRRSRWKLKFHHQALPPEYLDHYEAAMAQQDAAAAKSAQTKLQRPVPPLVPRRPPVIKHEVESKSTSPLTDTATAIERLHLVATPDAISSKANIDFSNRTENNIIHETSSIFGKHSTSKSSERYLTSKGLLGSLLASNNRCGLTETGTDCSATESDHRRSSVIISSIPGGNDTNSQNNLSHPSGTAISHTSNTANKVMNYQDLPYMGEITLDNMKPRRGRKPKKADICHLIYKNYGTVFPGMAGKLGSDNTEEWSSRNLHHHEPNTMNMSSDTIETNVPHSSRLISDDSTYLSGRNGLFESFKSNIPLNHSDVQNRIISSLLEKRLTATSNEANRVPVLNSEHFQKVSKVDSLAENEIWDKVPGTSISGGDNEPLNLCIKDLNQLKIRLLRKHDNFYESKNSDVTVKSEPPSPSEVDQTDDHDYVLGDFSSEQANANSEHKSLLATQQTSESTQETLNTLAPPICTNPSAVSVFPFDPNSPVIPPIPSGYVYWPSTGVFVHPMALQSQLLYYQKLGAIPILPIAPEHNQGFVQPGIPQVNILPPMSAATSSQSAPTKVTSVRDSKSTHSKSVIPKAFSMMVEASQKNFPHTAPSPNDPNFSRMKRLAPLGNPPTSGAPTKKKRSAIFIPPVPSENSTNPTTEVSICKFKFTGGAKPSLQEKKMLSVDSGGNFRYYSGTGDKSMRGYEFFPREALQQSSMTAGMSSSDHFLATASTLSGSERSISMKDSHAQGAFSADNPRTHIQQLPLCNDLLSRELPCTSVTKREPDQSGTPFNITETTEPVLSPADVGEEQSSQCSFSRRKRKTRKSLAREKLEQTFKEKGFLIQTQQLESAEGATYCKFRQLRKFTRYLFRSWKDYLPGNVREMSIAAGVSGDGSPHQNTEGVSEAELSSSSRSSPATHDLPENTTDN